jgi:predicted TIM-barrel fold metal-dependent hydrolase
MDLNDMVIVSVDDHIIEPPHLFERHLAKRFLPNAPRVRHIAAKNEDIWEFEGKPTIGPQLNAVVGRPKEELGYEPTGYGQIRAGCWQPAARVDDMNVNGVAASLNFPTFAGFALEMFVTSPDKELALALIQAHNDWMVDEWVAHAPDRFIPMCSLPLWRPEVAVEELRRLSRKGVRNISFPSSTADLGLPNIHHKGWNPLWDALAEEGTMLNIHCGGGSGTEYIALDSPVETILTKRGLSSMAVVTEWLWSDVIRDYPNMKIMLSEGDAGWIPYIMERAELVLDRHGPWTGQKKRRSQSMTELLRDHFYFCFIEDEYALKNRHEIGVDLLCYETDYPHADVTWPYGPEVLMKNFNVANVPDDEIDLITWKNACKALQFDGVERKGRGAYSVGALRARAAGVDMSPVGNGRGVPPSEDDSRVINAGDVSRQFGLLGVRHSEPLNFTGT